MGFNVDRHVVMEGFDAESLKNSFPGVPFVATRITGYHGVFLYIDVGTRAEATPIRLAAPYDSLDSLYEILKSAGATVAFSRDLVILNLEISRLFRSAVLSIDSNDDQRDLTVESNNGSLVRINFATEDAEFLVEHGEIHVYPLITESEDEMYLDLSLFHGGDYIVHDRDRNASYDVNRIARASLRSFLRTKQDVVDILLEDLSHPDEEVIVRYEVGTTVGDMTTPGASPDIEQLRIVEFQTDPGEPIRYGLRISIAIEWIDELVESIGGIKDAYMKWLTYRRDNGISIHFTVEAAEHDHAEIDTLIREMYADSKQSSVFAQVADFTVAIVDPRSGRTVHYEL